MEKKSYRDFRKKAEELREEKAILDYFFLLCESGDLRYEGRQGKEHYFAHPHQRTGSIAVNDNKNKWYDHSQRVGGDIISAVSHFGKKSFVEAIGVLDTSLHAYQPPIESKLASSTVDIHIHHELEQINHPALIKYIHSRGLEPQHFSGIAKEIHWVKGGRRFFGIGFSNDMGGYAIRSGIFKFNIGPNRPTTTRIGTDPRRIKIFEGGFDLASYRKLYPSENYHAIVVNGLANLSTPYMEEINSLALNLKHAVDLYLDNDPAGDEKTKLAKQLIKNAEDGRGLYQDFQDLNDYLVSAMVRKLGR